MAELKTRVNDASPAKFIDAVADGGRREDCRALLKRCIYVKRLADLDMHVLERLVAASVKKLQKNR